MRTGSDPRKRRATTTEISDASKASIRGTFSPLVARGGLESAHSDNSPTPQIPRSKHVRESSAGGSGFAPRVRRSKVSYRELNRPVVS